MSSTGRAEAWIGHVNLNVTDLERAIAFYCDVLDFHETQHTPGSRIVFLAFGDSPLQLALYAIPAGKQPPPGSLGLDHVGIQYPSREALARAYRRLLDHGIALSDAQEHGAMESLYFSDPDGNGLEIYWEYPPERWPYVDGKLRMHTRPLDLNELLAEADE